MKRLIDIFVSLFIILLLIFPFIVISILIKFDSEGPILHFSKRIGLNNKIFEMPKFRTMLLSAPQIESNKLINPSLYITKNGNFLRRYSLDELPQFFLVLLGIMTTGTTYNMQAPVAGSIFTSGNSYKITMASSIFSFGQASEVALYQNEVKVFSYGTFLGFNEAPGNSRTFSIPAVTPSTCYTIRVTRTEGQVPVVYVTPKFEIR